MHPEPRPSARPSPRGLSLPARLVIGGLALFGALAMVQWVVNRLFGLLRFALVVVVVVAVAGWVVSAKGRR